MKAIVNNRIQEIEGIHPSYLHGNCYIKSDNHKKYLNSIQIINSLNLYCTYFAENQWKPINGKIFDCKTEQELDFDKKQIFQYYTNINNQVLPAFLIDYLGEINFSFDYEYFYKIDNGTYSTYRHQKNEVIVDLGCEFAVFETHSFENFEYFQLSPNTKLCWSKADGIEKSFISKNPENNLFREYRVSKIRSLI